MLPPMPITSDTGTSTLPTRNGVRKAPSTASSTAAPTATTVPMTTSATSRTRSGMAVTARVSHARRPVSACSSAGAGPAFEGDTGMVFAEDTGVDLAAGVDLEVGAGPDDGLRGAPDPREGRDDRAFDVMA